MAFSQTLTEALTQASAKALATHGPHGINVVPVSMIKVNVDSLWLFDCFMDKTVQNIETEPMVALTTWSDMTGIQIKALASYHTEGADFDEAVAWVATHNPARVVKGLIILTPTEVFDISPGGAFATEDLAI